MMASSIDSASAESDIHELLVSSDDDNFEEVGSRHNERAREGEGAGEDSAETRRVNMVENPESSSEDDDKETAEVEVSRTRKDPSVTSVEFSNLNACCGEHTAFCNKC